MVEVPFQHLLLAFSHILRPRSLDAALREHPLLLYSASDDVRESASRAQIIG
jgi:hypothetical protein